MPSPAFHPVSVPAAITPHALALGSPGSDAIFIGDASPLPIRTRMLAASATPLVGTLSASATVGPFAPELGRSIWLSLSGDWMGTVQLLRSTDGGATKLPLTVGGQPWASFTANANEPVGDESDATATYWLTATLTGGTLGYRVAQ